MTSSLTRASAVQSAKLSPPATPSALVIRHGIEEMLRAASSAKLVIVRAPAGFGKTTAMLQHRSKLERARVATSWLTLDSADNDPSRFLAGLEAAISAILPDEPEHPPADPATRTIGDVALKVMDRIADLRDPFVLFVDDFEALQDPGVVAWVRELIEHLPRAGQLIIGSRCLPNLGLGRLRARGHLVEIEAAALRFTFEETEQFFRSVRHMPLGADDVQRLHQKTEGWPAALWLASASLERNDARSDFIARFSGTNRSVADYLAEDVIARQPEPVRRFLLRTSILRYLTPALCAALLPDVDCEAILGQLEASSLIAPIDSDDRSWRYHGLIATFLRAQLLREAARELPGLHAAAANWYESQGRPVPAIDHALEGGDFAHAVALLDQHAPALLRQGRMRLLTRWFDVLPKDALSGKPSLLAVQVWALSFTRGAWEAMDLLRSSGLEQIDDPSVRSHVLALRPLLLSMMDRFEEALEVGQVCLLNWPTGLGFADMVLANAMANVFAVMGQYTQSRRLLETARSAQGTSSSPFNVMYSETVEGIIDLQEGRLRESAARFRLAVGSGGSHQYGHASGNAWAGVMYAATVYEANDLKQAAHLLQVYVPLARDVALADHVTLGHVMLSRIAFARGDVDDAFETLTQLEYQGHGRRLARMVAGAKLERARLLLMQGHAQAAKEEIARADDPSLWERVARLRLSANDLDYLEMAQLRWEVKAGDARAALPRLRAAVAQATSEARHRRALKLRVLRALAHQRIGEVNAAQDEFASVLKLVAAEGFVRLLLDEGDAIGPLLRHFSRTMQANDLTRRDPVLAEYVLRLLDACGAATETDELAAGTRPALLEPLTPKEIRVLQLLAEGYSNSAIAEKLYVSDSTVRTHLRNINSKVDAHSRTQAVAIARRLGVIS